MWVPVWEIFTACSCWFSVARTALDHSWGSSTGSSCWNSPPCVMCWQESEWGIQQKSVEGKFTSACRYLGSNAHLLYMKCWLGEFFKVSWSFVQHCFVRLHIGISVACHIDFSCLAGAHGFYRVSPGKDTLWLISWTQIFAKPSCSRVWNWAFLFRFLAFSLWPDACLQKTQLRHRCLLP